MIAIELLNAPTAPLRKPSTTSNLRKRPLLNRFGEPVMRPMAATLYEWEIAGARALGKGNFSLGVRKALKRAGVKPPMKVAADSPIKPDSST